MIKMKGKYIVIILAILMLVAPLTVVAEIGSKTEISSEESIKLVSFREKIDNFYSQIQESYNQEECNEIISQINSALSKSILTNLDDVKTIDLEIFENELNSQFTLFNRNVVRFYQKAFISAGANEFSIIRTPYEPHFRFQFDWVFRSGTYDMLIYTEWQEVSGDIPIPVGSPALYSKLVFFEGWEGWHKPVDENGAPNGIAGLIAPVFAIGKRTDPNSRAGNVLSFFEIVLERFPILAKLLETPMFIRLLNQYSKFFLF